MLGVIIPTHQHQNNNGKTETHNDIKNNCNSNNLRIAFTTAFWRDNLEWHIQYDVKDFSISFAIYCWCFDSVFFKQRKSKKSFLPSIYSLDTHFRLLFNNIVFRN